MKTKVVVTVLAVAVMGLTVWGFVEGRKERAIEAEREKPVNVPSRVRRDGELTTITLDAPTQKRSGLTVATLHPALHRQELQATATVLSPQELSGSRAGLVAARSQVDTASAAAQAARAEYRRLRVLHDEEQDVSDKMLQAADSALRAAEASLQAAQAALAAAEQTASQQWGAVLGRAAAENSALYARFVMQQDALLLVVLPAGASIVQPPSQARVQLQPDRFVMARLIEPARRTDPRLQGASFFYAAPAVGLLPGTSTVALLPVGANVQGSLIPASAIVWWLGRSWVYTQNRADRFVRRELPADNAVQDGWFVTQGFAAGEPVVVTGAQLLLSEELRSQIRVGDEGGS